MRAIIDSQGTRYTLGINVGAIELLRGCLGVDLLGVIEAGGGQLLADLSGADPVLVVDVLGVLCGRSAHELDCALDGETITQAAWSLSAELLEFFPEGKRSKKAQRSKPLTAAECWEWIWELAGVVGVDPRGLTLRQLVWMDLACRRERWDHTADLIAYQISVHTGKHVNSGKFNPLRKNRDRVEPTPMPITALKSLVEGQPVKQFLAEIEDAELSRQARTRVAPGDQPGHFATGQAGYAGQLLAGRSG